MPMLKPQGTAGWTYYGAGGQYAKSHGRPIQALPAQQEQETDVFGILNQQYQQEMKNLDMNFAQAQEETLRSVRYDLQKMSKKYEIERSYIEELKIPADQKRQKLLQLNAKYELAAVTAKSKVKPETDAIGMQRQQMFGQLQQAYQQKQRDLKLVQKLFDKGVIKDQYAKIKEQYEIVGINYPVSYFRPPEPLSMEEIAEQQGLISYQIMNLEEAAKTATGEERKAIVSQIAELNKQKAELMGVVLPEYKKEIEKSNKLSNVGLQMQAGRKPGTLAEGIWQKKQKEIKKPATSWRRWGAWAMPMPESEKKETKTQPTPTELRQRGTKEAFNEGVKLGYWE